MLFSFRIGEHRPDAYTVIECENGQAARNVAVFAARCVESTVEPDMRVDPQITILGIQKRNQPGQGWQFYSGPLSDLLK